MDSFGTVKFCFMLFFCHYIAGWCRSLDHSVMIEKRLRKDGSVRYRVRIRIAGQPDESKTFARKADADLWVKNVRPNSN